MSALSLRSVTYSYPDASAPALRDVSLTIEPGEFVVVAGRSASGKSTLLHVASGLVPHFHGGRFAGAATVGELDVRDNGPDAISAVCGTVFQDPETQMVLGTVRGELAFALENRGWSPAQVARGVEEAALALGIESLLERGTDELSGGERQRVALGSALAGRPQILLLDEPTSQLDPVAGDELIWLLRRLNEEWGVTIVLVEHRLERCLAAADRVLAMADGCLTCDADPATFLEWAADCDPALQTPAARMFGLAGIAPAPVGVKQARSALSRAGVRLEDGPDERPRAGRAGAERAVLSMRGVWREFRDGVVALRGTDFELRAGERVALMGRNGAGKSSLLRCAAGLDAPDRGRVRGEGRVALLLQDPGDYLIHERIGDEASPAIRAELGLGGLDAERHPRDLSGGQRQRLALATVLDPDVEGASAPSVVCLDEPTRGMDRAAKQGLAELIEGLAAAGTAVVVATHDPEFVAGFAQRVVLLAAGDVIADAGVAEVLGGGWYFATEVARVLGGRGAALTPEQGARLIAAARSAVA